MRFEATLRIPFKNAQNAAKAVKVVEKEQEFGKRSEVSIVRDKNVVEIKINARDATALRAGVNNYLKLLSVVLEVEKRCENG